MKLYEDLQAVCDDGEIPFTLLGYHPAHEGNLLVSVSFVPEKKPKVHPFTRDRARKYWAKSYDTLDVSRVEHYFPYKVYTKIPEWRKISTMDINACLIRHGYDDDVSRRVDNLRESGIIERSAKLAALLVGGSQ